MGNNILHYEERTDYWYTGTVEFMPIKVSDGLIQAEDPI